MMMRSFWLLVKAGDLLLLLLLSLLLTRDVAYAKRLEWDATMVNTPHLVADRLWEMGMSASSDGKSLECNRPEILECTCFEVLGTNGYLHSNDDIKRGYRNASKIYHPDKGGQEDRFLFLQSCYAHLMKPFTLAQYLRQVEEVEFQRARGRWIESKYRDEIQQLNEEWMLPTSSSSSSSQTQRRYRRRTSKTKSNNLLFCWRPLIRGVYAAWVRGKPCDVYCDSRVVRCS